jgi:hypothetical protein
MTQFLKFRNTLHLRGVSFLITITTGVALFFNAMNAREKQYE